MSTWAGTEAPPRLEAPMNLRGPTPTGRHTPPPLAHPAAIADQGRRDSTLNQINARYYANAIVTKMAAGDRCFKNPSRPILSGSSASLAAKPKPPRTEPGRVSFDDTIELRRLGSNDSRAIAQWPKRLV